MTKTLQVQSRSDSGGGPGPWQSRHEGLSYCPYRTSAVVVALGRRRLARLDRTSEANNRQEVVR